MLCKVDKKEDIMTVGYFAIRLPNIFYIPETCELAQKGILQMMLIMALEIDIKVN